MKNIIQIQGSKYTDLKRKEVIYNYVILGNIEKVSQITNVPARTIRDWQKTDWWYQSITEARQQKNDELDCMFSETIEHAGREIKDRIINGDYIVGKDGELTRRPMSGKDLAIVQGIQFEKRQLNRSLPTQIKTDASKEQLKKLAESFEQLVSGKIIEGELFK